jgi:hypothetical protein
MLFALFFFPLPLLILEKGQLQIGTSMSACQRLYSPEATKLKARGKAA